MTTAPLEQPQTRRCLPLFPTAAALAELPTLDEGWNADLKIAQPEPGSRYLLAVRVWLARSGLADGEPFERTVYVEVLDDEGRWVDLGHYDGDEPPESLGGYSPADLGVIGAPL